MRTLSLLLLAASCAAPEPAPLREPLVAASLVVETLDGHELDLRGKPVALVYWQSW